MNNYEKQDSNSNYRSVVSSKKHIQYLGHLISDEGIQPLPEKLESIAKMPVPQNAKQVKQFLGLVGYYRKFVPHFSDIARPFTQFT